MEMNIFAGFPEKVSTHEQQQWVENWQI